MENEIWKDIDGYNDIYQISNLGRVRSKDRFRKNGFKKGIVLKQQNTTSGYNIVGLKYKGNHYSKVVHQLVWDYFGSSSRENFHVDHIDGNKKNNRFSNLQLLTPRDNKLKVRKIFGAYKKGNRWYSRISINGKDKYLGTFSNKEDALKAYAFAKESL